MTVVCSFVKNTVVNNDSELFPGFFTTPEECHPDRDFSPPSRNPTATGDSDTRLTTPLPHTHKYG